MTDDTPKPTLTKLPTAAEAAVTSKLPAVQRLTDEMKENAIAMLWPALEGHIHDLGKGSMVCHTHHPSADAQAEYIEHALLELGYDVLREVIDHEGGMFGGGPQKFNKLTIIWDLDRHAKDEGLDTPSILDL